jgi:hypothetical protein
MSSAPSCRRWLEQYAKHCSLNLGQAAQGLRYCYSHPDIDDNAPRRTLAHLLLSLRLRSKRIANDLLFAALPPEWHHSESELAAMTGIPASAWFLYGYCAWRFTDTGALKDPLPPNLDKRWDPRCKAPHP